MARRKTHNAGLNVNEMIVWFVVYLFALLSCLWISENVFSTKTESYGSFTSMTDNLIYYYQTTSVVFEKQDDNVYIFEKEMSPLLNDGKMQYDADKNDYLLELNNTPVSDVVYEAGYFDAKLNYSFRNVKNNELIYDELTIRLEFNQKNTTLFLTTSGGSVAANYWITLFDCNGLKINLYQL